MLGFAAAGRPKDPESHIERTISFGEFFKGDDVYVVEAVGDSMIESLIGDGDYVILRKCENPENNTIVVAYVRDPKTENGGLTIKRYKNHQLLPDNDKSDVPPLDVTSNVQILGNYIGVIRKDQPKKQRKATKKPKR